jgi:flagellar basal-body rod protein FlgB
MSPIDIALAMKALDGLHQRYLYTAQNIANANTPDYQPMRVSFEAALREAARSDARAIEAVTPELSVDGEAPMRLDLELATASETAARYRAVMDIFSRQLSLHHLAVGGGGR